VKPVWNEHAGKAIGFEAATQPEASHEGWQDEGQDYTLQEHQG
jgi:hypothetical protein